MEHWTEAERFLLERVRQRDSDAWSQLVARYEGRLRAFARGRGGGGGRQADAEDMVQETFLRLLRSVNTFRGEASLETYLFLLLRRTMIDAHRGRRGDATTSIDDSSVPPPAGSASTSRYVAGSEQLDQDRIALATAVAEFAEEFRRERNFRDLNLAEMLFYGQRSNTQIAAELNLDPKYVALLKHRWIKQLRGRIDAVLRSRRPAPADSATDLPPGAESLLSEVWEDYRPTCPKRTTLGSSLLGTLDADWQGYVDFHVNRVGCRACNANLADLRAETAAKPDDFRQRVLASSVGFFRR
jgi:RNA polymerase sigma factor (sigma-70 family)